MPQLSLYVNDETMGMLKEESRSRGVSISRYANELMQRGHGSCSTLQEGSWPPGYWESVYGCLADDETFPLPEDPPIDFVELDRELDVLGW